MTERQAERKVAAWVLELIGEHAGVGCVLEQDLASHGDRAKVLAALQGLIDELTLRASGAEEAE